MVVGFFLPRESARCGIGSDLHGLSPLSPRPPAAPVGRAAPARRMRPTQDDYPRSGSGAKGRNPCDKHPRVCTQRSKLRLERPAERRRTAQPDKTRQVYAGPDSHGPRMQAKFPRTGEISGRKAFFLLDRARTVLFLTRQKENGGCNSRVPVRYGCRNGPANILSSLQNNPPGCTMSRSGC